MKITLTVLLQHYWYIIILVFILGVISILFYQKIVTPFFNRLKQKAQLIKKYWTFVFIFVIVSILIYALILVYIPTGNQSLTISIYNNVLALVFAIFVGYFAFLQVVENRRDKLREEADRYLQIEKNYPRAIDIYEKCLAINADDFDAWANLLELYLITGRYDTYNEKINIAKDKKKYSENELVYLYLLFANDLMKEDIGNAKRHIGEIVTYVRDNPSSLSQFRWGFEEVKSSAKFISLNINTKKMYTNLADYLLRTMSSDRKTKFENGEYDATS